MLNTVQRKQNPITYTCFSLFINDSFNADIDVVDVFASTLDIVDIVALRKAIDIFMEDIAPRMDNVGTAPVTGGSGVH